MVSPTRLSCVCVCDPGLTNDYRVDDLDLPVVHPKMSFIIGAIDKEIRLSFAQRIRGTLPDPYQDLITEGKEKDIPDFKYAVDSKSSFDVFC